MAKEGKKPDETRDPSPMGGVPPPVFYTNVIRVGHSAYEFTLDFGFTMPESPGKAQLQARAILSPTHMKALLKAVADNLKKYEEQFGKISFPKTGPGADEILGQFGG